MRTVKIMIDTVSYSSKPTKEDIPKIKMRLKNSSCKDVTVNDLFEYIGKGYSFVPSVLKDGTKNENWVQQELIGIDVDNHKGDKDIVNLDKTIKELKKKNINPIGYYYTFSSTEEVPRFRLLFLLDKPIINPNKMKNILEILTTIIDKADRQCSDLSRTFYGTNKEYKILDAEATISVDNIVKFEIEKTKKELKKDKVYSYELKELIDNFSLLEYMKKENEVSHTSGNITYFKNCSICKHNDCLRYYNDTNMFKCFGANGGNSGNIINYLMVTKNISKPEAIRYFKYNILGLEDTMLVERNTHLETIKDQLKRLNVNFNSNAEWLQFITKKTGDGEIIDIKVNCPILAQFIRENLHYIFVRDTAKSGILRYFYIDGYYKLVSDEEIKGVIKSCIPLAFQKTKDINEVLNLLYTDLKFVSIEKLNNDENIINFNNGILNLITGELLPHSPKYLSTIRIPCNYIENLQSPPTKYFDRFITTLANNQETVKNLILQFMGVILSNVRGYRMKQALIMVGSGNTGKSVCKNFLTTLLGNENYSSIDLKDLEKQFNKIQLLNKRLVGSNDMSYMTISELETFKQATGGDPIYAEYKGENGVNFTFNGVLYFCGNRLPKFGGDRGDWVYDRIVLVQCNNVIPEEKQDKRLNEHLQEEKEYIVSLAIKQLKQVIANGYKYDIPESCKSLKENYKKENHSFLTFMEECVIERANHKVSDKCTVKKLYDVYSAWCADNNHGYRETKKEVHNVLVKLGKGEKIKTGGGYDFYKSITLSPETKKDYQHIYGYDEIYNNYSYNSDDYSKIVEE